ncbi:hypothetical protein Slin15195_G001810 [Septoria linicola]|uniref:Uncharacterized protein n=1 Tax=Septoria linicola TaxID=215465 RepID=A0A9Q9EET7_9PEZI|nr:hypothetical protein Slin14017_G001840 [Septoria linicola]USW46862.1 hypothetical protein Slin15195_G001810 [Septoria linicola]
MTDGRILLPPCMCGRAKEDTGAPADSAASDDFLGLRVICACAMTDHLYYSSVKDPVGCLALQQQAVRNTSAWRTQLPSV